MATLEKAGYQDAINGLPTRKLHPDDMPNYLAGYRQGTRDKARQIQFDRETELMSQGLINPNATPDE